MEEEETNDDNVDILLTAGIILAEDDCSTICAGRLFQILMVSGKKDLWYIKVLANGILYLYMCPLTNVACGVKWVVGILVSFLGKTFFRHKII
jgi:hypothetical protein